MNLKLQPEDFLSNVLIKGGFLDLGKFSDPDLAGIYIPKDELDSVPIGVTSQFLDNPEDFHHCAPDTEHTEWLINNALARIREIPSSPLVLDVGSGSGNTAFALLKVLRDPTILATDISRPLLRATKQTASSMTNGASIVPVCIDLNKSVFQRNSFDLAVGRAILHHLFEPDLLIKNLYRAIKPGASMIFYEPNESGYAVFHMLLTNILETSHRLPGLSDKLKHFIVNTVAEYQNCTPKDVEEYADIDDKWNFSRTYFEEIADDLGARLRVYPLYPSPAPFSGELEWRMKAAINADRNQMPQWGWDIIAKWEKRLSPYALDEMTCAASIIFTKPESGS